jgi:hypothetical protein
MGVLYKYLDFISGGVIPLSPIGEANKSYKMIKAIRGDLTALVGPSPALTLAKRAVNSFAGLTPYSDVILWLIDHQIEIPVKTPQPQPMNESFSEEKCIPTAGGSSVYSKQTSNTLTSYLTRNVPNSDGTTRPVLVKRLEVYSESWTVTPGSDIFVSRKSLSFEDTESGYKIVIPEETRTLAQTWTKSKADETYWYSVTRVNRNTAQVTTFDLDDLFTTGNTRRNPVIQIYNLGQSQKAEWLCLYPSFFTTFCTFQVPRFTNIYGFLNPQSPSFCDPSGPPPLPPDLFKDPDVSSVAYFDLGNGQFYFPAFSAIGDGLSPDVARRVLQRLALKYFQVPYPPATTDVLASTLFGNYFTPSWYRSVYL